MILGAVAQVSEVAAADIPPTSHPLPLVNVFREDVVRPSLSNAEALAAPRPSSPSGSACRGSSTRSERPRGVPT